MLKRLFPTFRADWEKADSMETLLAREPRAIKGEVRIGNLSLPSDEYQSMRERLVRMDASMVVKGKNIHGKVRSALKMLARTAPGSENTRVTLRFDESKKSVAKREKLGKNTFNLLFSFNTEKDSERFCEAAESIVKWMLRNEEVAKRPPCAWGSAIVEPAGIPNEQFASAANRECALPAEAAASLEDGEYLTDDVIDDVLGKLPTKDGRISFLKTGEARVAQGSSGAPLPNIPPDAEWMFFPQSDYNDSRRGGSSLYKDLGSGEAGSHWALLAIHCPRNGPLQCHFYNSLSTLQIRSIQERVVTLVRQIKPEIPNPEEYVREHFTDHKVPQQKNGADCALHVLATCLAAAQALPEDGAIPSSMIQENIRKMSRRNVQDYYYEGRGPLAQILRSRTDSYEGHKPSSNTHQPLLDR